MNAMQVDFGFQLEDFKLIIPLLGITFGFITFWFFRHSAKLKQQFNQQFGDENDSAKFIMFSRYFGGFVMGIIPLIIYLIVFPETLLIDIGIGIPENGLGKILLWIIALSALLVPLVANNAKKEKAQIHYPQIRIKVWKRKLIISNLLSWGFYFVGYEILYRGLLFFPFIEAFGLWPAIALNVAFFSLTHIPKGIGETLGAIPMAIVFCLLTYVTGSIVTALAIHIIISWTNNLVIIKSSPTIVYQKR